MQRTLVVGVDAATWDVMNPLLEAGRLPNIEALMNTGAAGSVISTMPPMTPLAWTSIATGVNPGEHGIYGFREQNRDTYEVSPIDFGFLSRPSVWDVFNAHEKTVGVINYPIASPPPELDGFFTSGFPGSDTGIQAYPEEAQQIARNSDFRVKPERRPSDGLAAYYREVIEITEAQRDLTLELLDRYDVDLLWPVFMGIDWVQHHLWDHEVDGTDAVASLYEHLDEIIGELVAAVGDDWNVIIISDHGFTPLEGEIHLNSVLEELGFLMRKREQKPRSQKAKDIVAEAVWLLGSELPHFVKKGLKQVVPDEQLSRTREAANVGTPEIKPVINWSETVAFAYDSMGKVYIHTNSEYPEGTVGEKEFEAVRGELAEELRDLQHPKTGQQIISEVHLGEDLYQGTRVGTAPDLVVEPKGWKYAFYGDFDSEWCHDPRERIADHAPEGIVVLTGEGNFAENIDVSVSGIASGILAMSGLPVFEDANQSLLQALDLSPDSESPTKYQMSSAACDDREGVEQRLRDLGYM